MDAKTPQISVMNAAMGTGASKPALPDLECARPAMPEILKTEAERRLFNTVTKSLLDAQLVHKTDQMLLAVIVKTYCRWSSIEEELDNLVALTGSYIITTPNGFEQPHQLFYTAQKLKNDLLRWLPEACLTIPSFAKVKSGRDQPQNGDLFAEQLTSFLQNRPL